MQFKNLDLSITGACETKEEEKMRKMIEEKYSARAEEVGKNFYKSLTERLANLKNEAYAGTSVEAEMRNTPRFCYIKNYGDNFDIEIDLLLHTFRKTYFKAE